MVKRKAVESPAMNPELWPVDRITPYQNNARTHPAAQISLLAELIRKNGADQPIVVDDEGVILKGHGRRLAAIEAGLKEFPVVQRKGLTKAEKSAMRIEDNQVALLSGWDNSLLKAEVIDLQTSGYPIALLGFADHQLIKFGVSLDHVGATDPNAEVEPPNIPVSRAGDIWVLGDHRLMCGDSTDPGSVARLLDGTNPHLMVTDPPYGVEYDADWRNRADRSNGKPYGASAVGMVENDDRDDWTAAWDLFPGDVVYCWHAGRHASNVQASLEAAGFDVVSQIIWAKTHLIISRGDYHWQA